MKTAIVAVIISVLALLVSGFGLFKPASLPQHLGATPGGDFLYQVNEWAGEVNKTQTATTSQGTAITISGNEFINWANSGQVSFSPGLTAAATLTFPASSSVASLVPNAGDREMFCIRNATTTANVYTIFAGSTGVNLLTSSSTLSTAAGSPELKTGKVGCFTLTREAKTATTYDIDALFLGYQ